MKTSSKIIIENLKLNKEFRFNIEMLSDDQLKNRLFMIMTHLEDFNNKDTKESDKLFALESIVNTTTQNEVLTNSSASINSGQGVITLVSQNNFSTTYNNLRNSIIDNTNLSLVFELNHQENAQNAGLSLRPTSVIVFGNPNLGTPLMQDSQTTALDLPQKFLVWEDENGEVKVSYNNPNFLKSRHLISNSQNSTLEDITNALNNLAISATN